MIYSTGKVFEKFATNFKQIEQFVPKFPMLFMSSIPEAFKIQFLFLIRKYEVSRMEISFHRFQHVIVVL